MIATGGAQVAELMGIIPNAGSCVTEDDFVAVRVYFHAGGVRSVRPGHAVWKVIQKAVHFLNRTKA